MPMTTACPSREDLAQIGMATGADAASCPPALAAHIEGCRQCREFLERRGRAGLESFSSSLAELPSAHAVPHIDGFAIERELGRGSMGVVYLAHRETLRRHVALKLMPGGRRAGARERRQWLREAEAASLVRHPNIVTLYEVAEADDWFMLVLEYVGGGTLADRLSQPLSPRNAARLIAAVARAVHEIHLAGQVHLDLKPSNILLDANAGGGWDAIIPKVSDFGIARSAEPSATDTGRIGPGGTPSYMAPEQITRPRREMSARADIHGLGAILYHTLTGRPPYQGATVLETIDLVERQEPVPPRRLNPKIPRDLETICLKCLQKDPGRRYPSAHSLADDLAQWLDGRPIKARPVSPPERVWRWCGRRPAVAALAGALALTLSAGFLSVLVLWRRAEAERRRAEADSQTTSEVLGQVVGFSVGAYQTGSSADPGPFIRSLQPTRQRLLEVVARQPGHAVISRQLGALDVHLGHALMQAGRLDEARAVLDESVRCWDEIIALDPLDREARFNQISSLYRFAEVAVKQGRFDEAVDHLMRAVKEGEGLVGARLDATSTIALCDSRYRLASFLECHGDPEQASSLMAANRRMLDNLPALVDDPHVAAWRVFSRLRFHRLGGGSSPTIDLNPLGDPPGHLDPVQSLSSPEVDRLPADAWAELVASALRSACNAGGAPSIESDASYTLMQPLAEIAAERRRDGELDEARQIADRLVALGQLLVRRHPGQSNAHIVLCTAYVQLYKNAWRTNDRTAVERHMRQATDEAVQALALDPTSGVARSQLVDLQRRLKDLLSPRPE
jgi:eukaryotic-like serine/threonine-protein kinase